jgi:hypothetical protein
MKVPPEFEGSSWPMKMFAKLEAGDEEADIVVFPLAIRKCRF